MNIFDLIGNLVISLVPAFQAALALVAKAPVMLFKGLLAVFGLAGDRKVALPPKKELGNVSQAVSRLEKELARLERADHAHQITTSSPQKIVKTPVLSWEDFGLIDENSKPKETKYETFTLQDLIDQVEGRAKRNKNGG